MRILIGYDGSKHSDAAVEDLKLAGLPRDVTALVVSVADPLAGGLAVKAVAQAMGSERTVTTVHKPKMHIDHAPHEAEELASKASDRLRSHFPEWEISTRVVHGIAASELIDAANDWNPDLIVVGPAGGPANGSVSKHVTTEAGHSVRAARAVERKKVEAPPKIIVGIDGSLAAREAVNEVGRRVWPKGTQIRLIVAHDQPSTAWMAAGIRTSAGAIADLHENSLVRAESMLNWAADQLKSGNSNISVSIQRGDPKRVLIGEARKWRADSIFVGSRNFDNGFERSQLGSVSTAVVTNTPCSVEVVRPRE